MVRRTREAVLAGATVLVSALALALGGCGSGSSAQPSTPPTPAKRVLDLSFGSSGQVTFPDGAGSIALAPDGSVFVTVSNGLAKVDTAGRIVSVGPAPTARAFAVDGGGNVFIASGPGVFRFDAAGMQDFTYAGSGVAMLYSGYASAYITSLVAWGDGSLHVIGYEYRDSPTGAAVWIVKLAPDGSVATSFGIGGRVTLQPSKYTFPGGAAIDKDGNLYVTFGNDSSDATLHVAKLDRNGNLAAHFGNAGIWSGSRTKCVAWQPAIDSSGSVWLPGECIDAKGAYGEALVKLDANGAPVAGFGNGGYVEGFFGEIPDKTAESIALAAVVGADGAVYVSGYAGQGLPRCYRRRVAALDAKGNRIASFGIDGIMLDGSSVALDAANRLYVLTRAPDCQDSGRSAPATLSRYL